MLENLGVDINNIHFKVWFLVLPIIYILIAAIFRVLNIGAGKSKKGSRTSDVLSFYIVGLICVIYISIFGIIGWFEIPLEYNNVVLTTDVYPETIFSQSQYIENYLIYPMIMFQGWNLILCLFLSELNDMTMLAHHTVVILSCQGSLQSKFMQYYSLYMYGILEISNIFLTFMDVFKLFPTLIENYPLLYQIIRNSFAVSFIIVRLIGFPYYMYFFERDLIYLFWNPKYRLIPISDSYLLFVFSSTIFVVILQFYWGSIIIRSLLGTGKKKINHDLQKKQN